MQEAIPMDLTLVLKQPQCDTMDRRVPPPFIKETTRSIQVLEIVFIRFGAPKLHVPNLEIAPKMTRAVPVRFYIVFRPPLTIHDPLLRIILVQVFWMCCHEFFGLWPQGRYGLRCIVKVDGEPVGLIVVTHPAKNVVINVAEKVYLWLDTPVVADILKGGVFIEHATIPAAHLMIRHHGTILNLLLFKHLGRLIK